MTKTVDLNVDVGEGFGFDDDLFRFATSANIGCGEHAGTRDDTLAAIEKCQRAGIRIGVHPGYPDREGMGRRSITDATTREWLDSVFKQTEWFLRLVRPAYLKPHGAFYKDTSVVLEEGWDIPKDVISRGSKYMAGGITLAKNPGVVSLSMLLRIHRLDLMGLEVTAHAEVARRAGQRLLREGFADRRYRPDGTLVPRSEPDAVLADPEEVRQQVLVLAPRVDSICVHGDSPGCVATAEVVYRTLVDAGWQVAA